MALPESFDREISALAEVAELLNDGKTADALTRADELAFSLPEQTEDALRLHLRQRFDLLMGQHTVQLLSEAGDLQERKRLRQSGNRRLLQIRSSYVEVLSPAMQEQLEAHLGRRSGDEFEAAHSQTRTAFDQLFKNRMPLDGIMLQENVPMLGKRMVGRGNNKKPEQIGTIYTRILFTSTRLRGERLPRQVAIEVALMKKKKASEAVDPVSKGENCSITITIVDAQANESLGSFIIHSDYTPNFDPETRGAPLYRPRPAGTQLRDTQDEPTLYAMAPDAIAAWVARTATGTGQQDLHPPRRDDIPHLTDEEVALLHSQDLYEPGNNVQRTAIERRQREIEKELAQYSLSRLPGGPIEDIMGGIDWRRELENLANDLPVLLDMAARQQNDPMDPLQVVESGVDFDTNPMGGRSTSRHK